MKKIDLSSLKNDVEGTALIKILEALQINIDNISNSTLEEIANIMFLDTKGLRQIYVK